MDKGDKSVQKVIFGCCAFKTKIIILPKTCKITAASMISESRKLW
jgi:hypothetical protein